MEIVSSCAEEDKDAEVHYTFGEFEQPEPSSMYVKCGERIRLPGPGKIIFRARLVMSGNAMRYPSDVVQMEYTIVKPIYETFPVGILDFEVIPRFKVHVVEKNLEDRYCSTKRNVRGRLVVLENPIGHFDILQPKGGCGKLAQPSESAAEFNASYQAISQVMLRYDAHNYYTSNITNWREKIEDFDAIASGSNCLLTTNAGFFNVSNHDCIGNIASLGDMVHTTSKKNVNFGIRRGSFYTGYLDENDNEPFDTLISGLGWLVRKGNSYISESLDDDQEDMSAQSTGSKFPDVLSARTAIGHDIKGRLMILQVEGETLVRGMNLYEFADFSSELGMYSAINLDGGGSATMSQSGVLISEPSWHCKNPDTSDHSNGEVEEENYFKYSYCAKEVSSITCIHVLPPLPFTEAALPSQVPSASPTTTLPTTITTVTPSIANTQNPVAQPATMPVCQTQVNISVDESLTPRVVSTEGFTYLVTSMLLIIMLLISTIYNCKFYWKLQRNIKVTEMANRGLSGTSGVASSSSLLSKGGKAATSSYSKVQVDCDDSDEELEIEFNDLDMNPKEFNPFNRLKSAISASV